MTADAAENAKQFAADAAESVTGRARHLVDSQIGAGADLIVAIAGAAQRASTELETERPQIAKLVHSVADRVDDYSDQLRDQSVADLVRGQFTRRQPALVFGLAALAGFVAWRVVKTAPASSSENSSPSLQPYSENRTRHGYGPGTLLSRLGYRASYRTSSAMWPSSFRRRFGSLARRSSENSIPSYRRYLDGRCGCFGFHNAAASSRSSRVWHSDLWNCTALVVPHRCRGHRPLAGVAFLKGRADAREEMTPTRTIHHIKQAVMTNSRPMLELESYLARKSASN